MRCKDNGQDKTLVLIAPKRRFLDVRNDDPKQNYGDQMMGEGWLYMGRSDEDDGINRYQGLSLNWLTHTGLPTAKGMKAWW